MLLLSSFQSGVSMTSYQSYSIAMLPKGFPCWIPVCTSQKTGSQDGLSSPVLLKYHNAGCQGIIRSKAGTTSNIKSVSFCNALGLASIHVIRLKLLKLKVLILAVDCVGFLYAFRVPPETLQPCLPLLS